MIKNEERNSSGQGQIIARVSVSGSAVKTERFPTPQKATSSSKFPSKVTISLADPFLDAKFDVCHFSAATVDLNQCRPDPNLEQTTPIKQAAASSAQIVARVSVNWSLARDERTPVKTRPESESESSDGHVFARVHFNRGPSTIERSPLSSVFQSESPPRKIARLETANGNGAHK